MLYCRIICVRYMRRKYSNIILGFELVMELGLKSPFESIIVRIGPIN